MTEDPKLDQGYEVFMRLTPASFLGCAGLMESEISDSDLNNLTYWITRAQSELHQRRLDHGEINEHAIRHAVYRSLARRLRSFPY
jgi:hypothetical protein